MKRGTQSAVGLAVAFVVSGSPRVLRAEPAPDIVWNGPAGCGDAERVRARTLAILGAKTEEAWTAQRAQATVRAVEGGYRLSLSIEQDGETVTRELEAPSCDELVEAAALVLAVAAEARTVEPAEPVPIPAPVEVAQPPPPELAPAPAPPERPKAPQSRFGLDVHGFFAPSVTVPFGFGLGGDLMWLRGAARVFLGVRHVFARPAALGELDGVRARASLSYAEVGACGAPGIGRFEFPLCGAIALGGMRAASEGTLRRADFATELWAAAIPSAGVAVRLGRTFALTGRFGVVVPFVRPGFALLDAPQDEFRTPRVGGLIAIGVQIRVPAANDP